MTVETKDLNAFLTHINRALTEVEFEQTMAVIEHNYDYTPTAFKNGDTENEAGTNAGSCKIFAFAALNNLSELTTLSLFGKYYREDVLGNPEGEDHANIRNFIEHGWNGVEFDGQALTAKA